MAGGASTLVECFGIVSARRQAGFRLTARQGGLTSGCPDGMLDGMMTPDAAERQHSLRTAVARYDDLRLRDSVGEADPLTYVGGSAA